jgi:hypothetical protein
VTSPGTGRRARAAWIGLLVGFALGFAAILDGFVGFVVVAFLGGLGLLVGLSFDGTIDPLSWIDRDRRERR